MARGGYRNPGPGQPPAGPGRFSRRTDGNAAPNRPPGLSGSDLQYGDVGKLQEGMRAVPLPQGGGPAPAGPGGGGGAGGGPPLGAPANASGLAPFVTETPSGRPGEPITNGMDMGPGADSGALSVLPDDDRTAVLQFLATTYGNQDALEMLNEMRGAAAGQPNAAPQVPAGPAGPPPAAPGAASSPPPGDAGSGGSSFDAFLTGDATDQAPIAEPPVPEAAAPQGPSHPLPAQT